MRRCQHTVCQWRRAATPEYVGHTTRCAMPGYSSWSQPGQRYGFVAAAPGTGRTTQSPSGQSSIRSGPSGADGAGGWTFRVLRGLTAINPIGEGINRKRNPIPGFVMPLCAGRRPGPAGLSGPVEHNAGPPGQWSTAEAHRYGRFGGIVKVLLAGASGFVGRRLCTALDRAGHDVVAMTRNPARYQGAGTPVHGDVQDPATLGPAMAGCQAAYYLVHSLQDADFEHKDAAGATAFGAAAARAGLRRIVYLGGLGDDADNLSAHLRSRREVESLLGAGGVPVTVIRAGIIIGHGGVSWELTRQLVEHLPVMVTPKWVATRTQPVAVADVVTYLAGVLEPPEAAGRVYEAGGPEVLQYSTMLRRVADIEHRPLVLLPVPLLSPWLSSLWLTLVTDVDPATGRTLIDSMTNEVIVRDQSLRELIPIQPLSYDDAVRAALREGRAAGPARA
jgi:uncharacterized protein YbjT (DUF2867 family)